MSKLYIIVEKTQDWEGMYPSDDVITIDEYLALQVTEDKRVRVINLCSAIKYLSRGYYCSLLAEARGHHVIPSVRTLIELSKKQLYRMTLDEDTLSGPTRPPRPAGDDALDLMRSIY